MKIYRLEFWCAIDNRNKWIWLPLSEFHTNKDVLIPLREEYKSVLDNCPSDNDTPLIKYVAEKTGEVIVDSRFDYPEIREYNLTID